MAAIRLVIFGFVIGIIAGILTCAGISKFHKKQKQEPTEQVVGNVKEQRKIDSLDFVIQHLNTKIDSSYKVINYKRSVIEVQNKKISDVWKYADSLQLAYNINKTIPKCDSLIQAKDSLIFEQKITITELNDEAIEYSRQVYLLNNKTDLQDILIHTKDSTITQLQCAYNWKIKHKLWAWVLGWKCN